MKTKVEENNIFKILRLIRNIKVSDLAKTLEVTPSKISAIEAGRHSPSKRLLRDYAQALGVTPEFIANHLPDAEGKDEKFEYYLASVLNDVLSLEQEERAMNQ